MAEHQWKRPAEPSLDDYLLPLQLAMHMPEDVLNEIIEVEGRFLLAMLLEYRADASDDVTGTMPLVDDTLQGRTHFVEVRCDICEEVQCRRGICYDSGERLVDLVGNRGRQFAGGRNAVQMHQLAYGATRDHFRIVPAPTFVEQLDNQGSLDQQRRAQSP